MLLTALFNKFLVKGKVPEEWKLAYAPPIFRTGSKALPGNYHLASLTSVVGKLMETVIQDKVVNHFVNDRIKDSQHSFPENRLCLTNLLDFYVGVISMCDESKTVVMSRFSVSFQ